MSQKKEFGFKKLLPDLFLFEDTCNVYVLKNGEDSVVVDFGSGVWMENLNKIGVRSIRHVFLTHAHRDQCYGLSRCQEWPFEVHASVDDLEFYRTEALGQFWKKFQLSGCPKNYSAPRFPMPFVKGDMGESGEVVWEGIRICVIPTPGHTRGALTYLVVWGGKTVAFCGDLVYDGGRCHQPYHLEWDHWKADGAIASWYGLERLGACKVDTLCPSHGPAIWDRPVGCIREAQRRVMEFAKAKGSVCSGEKDRWIETKELLCGARQVLKDLYVFGGNSYLLVGDEGEGFLIDPTFPRVKGVEALMEEVGVRNITTATATHFHCDHSDGLNWVRERFGTKVWLHPWVAKPIVNRNLYDLPWLPSESVAMDRQLPEKGWFEWNRYSFEIRPFPGQTWWHCAFNTKVSGQQVLFSGDNFQPPSRWNGTGGFCAYNGSRFEEGFSRSVDAVLRLSPDLICNGHGCIYRFNTGHYQKILRWSSMAERAIQGLCPSKDWLADYDCHTMVWVPFQSIVRAGDMVKLQFQIRNYQQEMMQVLITPSVPIGWRVMPEQRKIQVPGNEVRKIPIQIWIPSKIEPKRYVIAGEMEVNDRMIGEEAVALVDVEE